MFPTLHLTTPRMKGAKVAQAQHMLQGNNRWEHRSYRGPLDGKFGEDTAGAVREMKYWLGYPKRKQSSTFSHTLYGYLCQPDDPQRVKLPRLYKWRMKRRIKKAANWHLRILAYAKQFLDYHESPPGSNNNKFGEWYGVNGVPWCAEFVSYCLNHVEHGPKWFKYAYVPYIVRDARAGKNGMSTTDDPNQGDLVCYDWDDDGESDHVEFFDSRINATEFYAVGGNTGPSDFSNGGMVMRSKRSHTDVQAYVHVP